MRIPSRTNAALLWLMLAATPAASLHGQGCSQCGDQVRETPVRTRTAYQKAIAVLGGAGLIVFAGTLVVLKRFRDGR